MQQQSSPATEESDPESELSTSQEVDDISNNHEFVKRPFDQIHHPSSTLVARRIHVFASTPEGRFIAHSLKGIPNPPPVTLMFHNKGYVQSWLDAGTTLTVEYPDGTEVTHTDFQTELARSPFRSHGRVTDGPTLSQQRMKPHWDSTENFEEFDVRLVPDHQNKDLISTAILALRPQYIVPALLSTRHRLTAESTIFIVTDGMGVLEEIYSQVFPDVETRPSIVLGINTHDIRRRPLSQDPHFMTKEQSYWKVLRWKQMGTLSVSVLPRWKNYRDPEAFRTLDESNGDALPASTRYLLRTLRRTPILVSTFMRPMEFHLLQLEHLAMQSVLQSMVGLIDGRQAHLLHNWQLKVGMRVLAHEISVVIRSLPEIQGYPNLEERFSSARILRLVFTQCQEKKNKIPVAVYEMRKGYRPSVDYLNGWIVERGEELGLKPVANFFVQHTIVGKSLMVRHEMEEEMELAAEEYPPEMQSPRYN